MKKCPFCAEEIKDDDIVCRYCGRAIVILPVPQVNRLPPTKKNRSSIIRLILAGMVVIIAMCICTNLISENGSFLTSTHRTSTPTLTLEQVQQSAKSYSYKDLARYTEQYVGDIVHYQGRVIQVIEKGSNRYNLRVNITKEEYRWADTVYLNYRGLRVLEDDIIEFYGRVDGRITYKSVLGASITIPEITVIYLDLIE